jgi:hypothetical protein
MSDTNFDFDKTIDDEMHALAAGLSPADTSGADNTGSSPAPVGSPGTGSSGGIPGAPSGVTSPPAWEKPPSSWKSDYHAAYPALDPKLKEYIHQRERESLDGITKYKTTVDKWDEVFKPYKHFIDEANVDPRHITQTMMDTHIALTQGDAATKKQWADYLIKSYGLDAYMQAAAGGAPQAPEDPRIASMESRLAHFERQTQAQVEAAKETEISQFLADAKNVYAEELIPDMLQLVRAGMARTVAQAYEAAKWTNPTVRAKLIDQSIQDAVKPRKQAPANVNAGTLFPATGVKREAAATIDKEMNDIYAEITSRN